MSMDLAPAIDLVSPSSSFGTPTARRIAASAATQLGEFSRLKETGANWAITDSTEDAISFIDHEFSIGRRVSYLSSDTNQYYIITVVETRKNLGEIQDVFKVDSCSELCREWQFRDESRTFMHMGSTKDSILIVTELTMLGELTGMFAQQGELAANVLHRLEDKHSMGLLCGTYFVKEDKWILVLSSHAPLTKNCL